MTWKPQLYLLLAFLLSSLLGEVVYGYELRSRSLFAVDERRPKYVPGEILVGFKSGTPDKVRYEIHERCGATAAYPVSDGRFERAKFWTGKNVEEMIAAYENEPDVRHAEPNYIAHAFMVPNDPRYAEQWHFHSPENVIGGSNIERAWDISAGDSVIVAVVDTGVAYEDYGRFRQAQDLAGVHFVPGYDYVDNDTHPNDENGHGTHIAGVIAQRTNNGIGVAGAAFDCSIMPIRVLDEEGYGTYADIAEAVNFAVENGANVINLSLGSGYSSTFLMLSLAIAHDKGVTLVAAGGNEYVRGSPPSFPAAYDAHCISVAAVRYDGRRAWYSTKADYIDISAPGGNIYLDQNGDDHPDGILQQSFIEDPRDFDYVFWEGTSFAAPHVSAAAAMLISQGLTDPDKIAEVLTLSARDMGTPGWDSGYGYGILDVYMALKYAAKMGEPGEVYNRYGRLSTRIYRKAIPSEDTPEQSERMNALSSHSSFAQMSNDGFLSSTELFQNYPNPANPSAWIPYTLARKSEVVIEIYTAAGQLVRILNLGHRPGGMYVSKGKAAYWNGYNDDGDLVARGIYFYTLRADDFIAMKKMIVGR